MKRTYYHGTSADNLQSILKHGLSISEEKIWTCSQDAIYLWNADTLAECEGYADETEKSKEERAFQMAVESAQIACSIAKDCRIVVIKVSLPEKEVCMDDSSDNMECANCIRRNISPSEIQEIHVSNDLSLMRGYFLNMVVDREFSNISCSQMELKVASVFKGAEIYPEDLDEIIEMQKMQLPAKKSKQLTTK